MFTLRINNIDARTIGYGVVGDLEIQHRYSSTGGGLQVVSFSLACPRNYTHPALRQGSLVQILRGTISLGWAVMADPNRDNWTFVCDGLYTLAQHFTARGSTNPAAVVAAANARGMGWNGVGNLPNASLSATSEATKQLNTVADVLDEYCRQNNMRWGLDANNTPYVTADPTTPTVALTPGVPKMATAADDYASAVTVRYATAVSGTPSVPSAWDQVTATAASAPHGVREIDEDISDLGVLANGVAFNYAKALLDAFGARPAFTEAVEVGLNEVTTLGGERLAPWLPLCGQRVRHYGVLDSDGQARYGNTLEWVVGGTTYRPGQSTVTIAPTELAARTVAQVQAEFKAANEKGFT